MVYYIILNLCGGAHARVYTRRSPFIAYVHKTPAELNRITYYIVGNIVCKRGKWQAPRGYTRVKHTIYFIPLYRWRKIFFLVKHVESDPQPPETNCIYSHRREVIIIIIYYVFPALCARTTRTVVVGVYT